MKANEGWEEVGKLTKKEFELITGTIACKQACEKLVKEVVGHYERAHIQDEVAWSVLFDRLDISRADFVIRYDLGSKKIFKQSTGQERANRFISEFEGDLEFKEFVRAQVKGEKE